MKVLKIIMAVMAALLIVVNMSVISIFAVSAAPVAAGEILEILIALATAAGHSQSELSGMGVTQIQSLVTDDIRSGNITFDTPIVDPFSGLSMSFFEFMNKPENQAARAIIATSTYNFVDDVINSSDNSFGGIDHGGGTTSGRRDEYFKPTSTFTFVGNGAFMDDGHGYGYGCEYIIVDVSNPNNVLIRIVDTSKKYITGYSLNNKGVWQTNGMSFGQSWQSGFRILDNGIIIDSSGCVVHLYGDVRTIEGEDFPTDDEFEYVVGEADGTKVTLDMLNPDGTVTIDGVTYYPADYLDPDKLTDKGKDALADAIADAIDNTYVKSEDKPIVDVDDITVDVPGELQDYAVPVGIANVFPFCIPWDIFRGFQLLNEPVVTPKFEIPFNIPEFGLFPGVEKSITLDFSKYDSYIQVFRWFHIIGFSFLLCKLSMTRVKGGGA